jgi:hypothetical protein
MRKRRQEDPHGGVGRPSGRERDHQAHGLTRILGLRVTGQRHRHRGAGDWLDDQPVPVKIKQLSNAALLESASQLPIEPPNDR